VGAVRDGSSEGMGAVRGWEQGGEGRSEGMGAMRWEQ